MEGRHRRPATGIPRQTTASPSPPLPAHPPPPPNPRPTFREDSGEGNPRRQTAKTGLPRLASTDGTVHAWQSVCPQHFNLRETRRDETGRAAAPQAQSAATEHSLTSLHLASARTIGLPRIVPHPLTTPHHPARAPHQLTTPYQLTTPHHPATARDRPGHTASRVNVNAGCKEKRTETLAGCVVRVTPPSPLAPPPAVCNGRLRCRSWTQHADGASAGLVVPVRRGGGGRRRR